MFQTLYRKCLDLASHKSSNFYLGLVSFIESSFFPIPPDILLIPMILAKRLKAWFYALICTLSSVAGGLAGYAIGIFFYASVGSSIVEIYGLSDSFNIFGKFYT